jgi:hypothetical protein
MRMMMKVPLWLVAIVVGAVVGAALNMVLPLAPHPSVDANAPAIETKGR